MRQVRYRAVITLHPAGSGPAPERHGHWQHGHGGHRHHGPPPVPYPRSTAQTGPGASAAAAAPAEGAEYPNHTRELVLRTESRDKPGSYRNFPVELCWDDEMPLHPGDRHVVTVTVTDDEAPVFLRPGQQFTLWSGTDVGHGTITRPMYSFTEYGPF